MALAHSFLVFHNVDTFDNWGPVILKKNASRFYDYIELMHILQEFPGGDVVFLSAHHISGYRILISLIVGHVNPDQW